MLNVETLLGSLLALVLLAVVVTTLGFLFFSALRRTAFHNAFERLFFYASAGTVLVISAYAALVTHLGTVLLACPLLLVLFARMLPAQAQPTPRIDRRTVMVFIAAALLLYFGFYAKAFLSFSGDGAIKFASIDNLYYARLAAYLNQSGNENIGLEYLFPAAYKAPYHYGELWLCALVIKATGLRPPFALLLVTYPYLALLSVTGIAGFVLRCFPFHRYRVFVLLPALFFAGVKLLPGVLDFTYAVPAAAVQYPKILWVTVFAAGILSLLAGRHWSAFFVWVAMGGVTFVNVFPAFTGGALLAFGWLLFYRRSEARAAGGGLLLLLLTGVYLLLFYGLSATELSRSLSFSNGPEALWQGLADWKGGLLEVSKPLRKFLLLLPLALLMYGAARARGISARIVGKWLQAPAIYVPALMLLTGAAMWALTRFFTIEASQFFNNLLQPFAAIATAAGAYWILGTPRQWLLKSALLGLLLFLVQRHGNFGFDIGWRTSREWRSLRGFVGPTKAPVFVNLRPRSGFSDAFGKNTRLFQPLPELNYLIDPYINESLDAPFVLQDSAAQLTPGLAAVLRNTSFYQYLQRQPAAFAARPRAVQMLAFSKAIGADYIVVADGAELPLLFRNVVVDSLPVTGAALYRLR